jgi:hypothetical protein
MPRWSWPRSGRTGTVSCRVCQISQSGLRASPRGKHYRRHADGMRSRWSARPVCKSPAGCRQRAPESSACLHGILDQSHEIDRNYRKERRWPGGHCVHRPHDTNQKKKKNHTVSSNMRVGPSKGCLRLSLPYPAVDDPLRARRRSDGQHVLGKPFRQELRIDPEAGRAPFRLRDGAWRRAGSKSRTMRRGGLGGCCSGKRIISTEKRCISSSIETSGVQWA